MTQKSKLQAISVSLVSMKPPEANPDSLASAENLIGSQGNLLAASTDGAVNQRRSPNNCKLLINPNEPSEIVVKLTNSSSRSLITSLRVDGDFPSDWLQIGMEGNELRPHAEMEAVLYFQIPADFFENQEAIAQGQTLKINYQGQLQIYGGYDSDNGTNAENPPKLELLDIATFQLYVRSPSLYLEFLPDTYREVDFVGRLLKIFEETLEPDVQILDSLWAYLDPIMSPPNMLPFLAHWVGWEITPNLSIGRQRHLIKQAIEIYRWRGTRRGLRFYINLFTGLPLDEDLPESEKHIGIFEVTGRGFVIGEGILGANASTGGGRPFHFVVRIRNDRENTLDLQLIHQIIETEKPVFCTYDLQII
jgi:phage tail-like protein